MRTFDYKNPKPNSIFLDMDGVASDLNRYAEQLLGEKVDLLVEGHGLDHCWRTIEKCSRFYRELPVFEEVYELVNFIEQQLDRYNFAFLTAIPFNHFMPWVHHDKVEWAQHYFPGVPVFFGPFSKEKYKHAKIGDILIDDRLSNCNEWAAAGGIAIRHLGNYEDTLDSLKKVVA